MIPFQPIPNRPSENGTLRVLVCDDQATVRQLLMLLVSAVPGTRVVAEAEDAESAWSALVHQPIDLVLLDLELPGRHGFALLERITREAPTPVIVISGAPGEGSSVRDQAMALGALGFVQKPDGVSATHETLQASLSVYIEQLRKNRHDAGQQKPVPGAASARSGQPLVAIGSSTGGIIAVIEVLRRVPVGLAPIVITQHMLPGYAEGFAKRVSNATGHHVRVAQGGEVLGNNTVIVAPSGQHLSVRRSGGSYTCAIDQGEKVSGHRPSCDRLFGSVAEAAGGHAIGVILTGMGRDGAEGLLALRRAGALTIAQDEASSVVFGMPRAALELKAVDMATPLTEIGVQISGALAQTAADRTPLRSPKTELVP